MGAPYSDPNKEATTALQVLDFIGGFYNNVLVQWLQVLGSSSSE
jgi:hypothetical protein